MSSASRRSPSSGWRSAGSFRPAPARCLVGLSGGPLGVVFVASGSWLVARIGAINTALLVVGGQMVSGVAFDLMRSAAPSAWLSGLGVALILAGMALTQKRS